MAAVPVDFVLTTARSMVGTREDPPGSNHGPIVDLINDKTGLPWCAYFVSYILKRAGIATKTLAGVTQILDRAKGFMVLRSTPAPGSVFLYLAAGSNGQDGVDKGYNHTGFVVGPSGSRWSTVEGNVSNSVGTRTKTIAEMTGAGGGFVPFEALAMVFSTLQAPRVPPPATPQIPNRSPTQAASDRVASAQAVQQMANTATATDIEEPLILPHYTPPAAPPPPVSTAPPSAGGRVFIPPPPASLETAITPHFKWKEAVRVLPVADGLRALVFALAREMEFLRAKIGKGINVTAWNGVSAEINATGVAPDALAQAALSLGFWRVTLLINGSVRVELPDPTVLATRPQEPLYREQPGGAPAVTVGTASNRQVDARSPERAGFAADRMAAFTALLTIGGIGASQASYVTSLLAIAVTAQNATGCPAILLLGHAAAESTRPDAYRSEGKAWHAAHIANNSKFAGVIDRDIPDQWGSAGAFQMLRSTAIDLGFPANQKWAATLSLVPAADNPTRSPDGTKTGTFTGPFQNLGTAAEFSARLCKKLLDKYGGDFAKEAAAYNAGEAAVDRAIRDGGANWIATLRAQSTRGDAAGYAVSVPAFVAVIRDAYDMLRAAGG